MRIARKCSYCGNLGHNSRTCNTSLSHKQLDHYNSSSSSLTLFGANENSDNYLGSGLISTIQDSKKGMPWTEEEHKIFLRGLEKLGKGNWRGISRYFVTTRTPTQVASHAQKYFLRHSHNSFINRTKHHSLLNLGCESKTRFETFYEPSEAFGTLSGINDLTANYISCISQLSGNRNFVSQLLSHAHSVLKWPNSSTSMNCTPLKVALDLELKLATPMPLELTEACSADPLS